MADQYTEVSSQGYLSRLGNSLLGMLLGIALLVGSVLLLYWNEGRAVDASRALANGERQVVEASVEAVDPKLEGALIHATGPLTAVTPAKDPVFGIGGSNLVRVQRKVEMFQWQEQEVSNKHDSVGGTMTTEATFKYHTGWSEKPWNSSKFRYPEGHQNPAMAVRSQSFNAREIRLGAYRLSDVLLEKISVFHRVPIDGSVAAPPGYRLDGDGFYLGSGSATTPAVGDVRITFAGVPEQTISVVAGVSSGMFDAFREPNGYAIAIGQPGVATSEVLFHVAKGQESGRTWILRGVGALLMLLGFIFAAGPVVTLLAFLPLLEGMAQAGVFLIALTLTLPLTIATIAVAWFAHRPLISVGLGIGAVIVFFLLRGAHPKAQPAGATSRVAPR